MTVKIFSLDGGGSKGVFHLYFIKELEAALKCCIRDKFEVIGGTSVGGIIALAATHPLKIFNYRHDFYFSELLDKKVDERLLQAVFGEPRAWMKVPRLGLFGPKYADREVHTRSFYEKELFGDTTFGGNNVPSTMIFSYSLTQGCAKVFKSWRPSYQDIPVSVIARATSAAPMFFPATVYKGEVLIDGGVAANDPSFLMRFETCKNLTNPDSPLIIVSLGTSMKGTKDYSNCYKGGLLSWGEKYIGFSMETQQRIVTYLQGHDSNCSRYCDGCVGNHYHEILGANKDCFADYHASKNVHYFRFSPFGNAPLDSIDPAILTKLKAQAKTFFDGDSQIVNKMLSLLA